MKTLRRISCLLLALLMLLTVAPERAEAVETVYFTAANDTLLSLDDATTPFWYGGRLYAALTDSFCTELNLFYNYRRDTMKILVYTRGRALTADLASDSAEGNGGETYACHVILRGDVIFMPLDVLCAFFRLQYTFTQVSHGYLLRVTNASAVLSDATFIDAAGNLMELRYTQYQRAKAPPVTDAEPPVTSAAPSDPAQQTVYLAVSVADVRQTERLLADLSARQSSATFVFPASVLAESDGLLRRLVSGGYAVALEVDADDTLAAIEACNELLWRAANYKTRLVRLVGASAGAAAAVEEAGYCPIRLTLDLSGRSLSAAQGGRRIVDSAGRNGGICCAYLGVDRDAAGTMDALLQTLRAQNCSMKRLNEVAAALT